MFILVSFLWQQHHRKTATRSLRLPFFQVDFGSFATILREVAAVREPKAGGVFYDLGSGE